MIYAEYLRRLAAARARHCRELGFQALLAGVQASLQGDSRKSCRLFLACDLLYAAADHAEYQARAHARDAA